MIEFAPEIIALLFAAAVAAGFVDAIAGGGGLITVPVLLAVGVNPVAAIATNKIQGSFGTASATWTFWRKGRIDFALLKWPLIFTVIGAALGAVVVSFVDATWLMVLLPLLLAGIAVYFLVGPKTSDEDVHARLTPFAFGAVAGGIGFYDGFFGPGTGSFLIFLFVRFFGFDFLSASAAAKIVNVACNFSALMWFGYSGHLLWQLGLMMAACQVAGSLIGTRLAIKHGSAFVRKLFLIVVSLLILKTSYDAYLTW